MEMCDVVTAPRRPALRRGARLGLLLLAAVLAWAPDASPQAPARPRLLMVTYSGGYQHDVVRRASPDRRSLAEQTAEDLGAQSGAFDVTRLYSREDVERLSADIFTKVRAVLFYTTGAPPFRPEVRQALLRFVQRGGGFVGVHCATDTWYEVPEYGELVGAYFDGHPWTQRVRLVVEDPTHSSTKHLGPGFEITDEIYQFRSWSRDKVHVLLRLDPSSVDVGKGKRADQDYALSWIRHHGRGRVFYTALGHGREVWEDERFRRHLLEGIRWAIGAR
ncbi:MAG: ThuA domain-containing protein [Candidatus Rokuibacteriota bacterium]|nr:MAG: ThuA domain-containing protein [Candidatus Rokubacteria bacterium]PYN67277.1 MAG: ThuA domain-containing protein [Candidatus Rokubacteria bacterium]